MRANPSSLSSPPSNEASRPAETGRIPSLDGLRGIAIVLVLFQHLWHTLPGFLSPLGVFAGNGGLGVSIFFLLSGYLIYSLSVREYEKSGAFNRKQFYIRRALRIFPCFYFYILVILALAQFGWITVTESDDFRGRDFHSKLSSPLGSLAGRP
jgi:peptidoglycan/LPS O-acetylase OafA/YrhL